MAEPTTYIVLVQAPPADHGADPERWSVLATVNADSANQAIRKALLPVDKPSDRPHVAVPARSWKPVTVRAETSVTLKLEDAT